MASKWYSVKTFYRSKAEGQPHKPDRYCDTDATLLEERIVLIRAQSKTEAIKKAEKEANEYASKISYQNPYGQKVSTRYLGFFDLFEIEGNLADKEEIFLMSRIMSKKITDKKIAHVYVNKPNRDLVNSRQKVFINKDVLNGG